MLNSLRKPSFLDQSDRLLKSFEKTQALIEDLNQRELPLETKEAIQTAIEQVNNAPEKLKDYRKSLRKAYSTIVRRVQKDMGLSTKGYHLALWMSMGMAVFGVPFGIMFGAALDNMGLMSLGIPIGMGIGVAIGASLDEKAAKAGKQLSI